MMCLVARLRLVRFYMGCSSLAKLIINCSKLPSVLSFSRHARARRSVSSSRQGTTSLPSSSRHFGTGP